MEDNVCNAISMCGDEIAEIVNLFYIAMLEICRL